MQHVKSLDGLRGIAALIVVLFHMDAFFGTVFSPNGLYTQATLGWQIYRRVFNGDFSVAIFFVLSGYVLVLKYAKFGIKNDLRAGALKRYFRLTPIVLASTLLAVGLQSLIGFHNVAAARIIGGHQWLANAYPAQLTWLGALKCGLIGAYQGNVQYNGPLWTIRLELLGSFVLFGFVGLFYKSRFFLIYALIASCFMSLLFNNDGLYLSLFLIGAAFHKYPKSRFSVLWLIPAMVLATENPWTPEVIFIRERINVPINIDVLCHSIAAILMVAVVLNSRHIQKFLSGPVTLFLGRISFSLYAVHLPIMMSVGTWFMVHWCGRFGALAAIVTTIMVSVIIAFILTETLDKWAQSLANLVASRLMRADCLETPAIETSDYTHKATVINFAPPELE